MNMERINAHLRSEAALVQACNQTELSDTELFAAFADGIVDADGITAQTWQRVASRVGLENLVLSTVDDSALEKLQGIVQHPPKKDWALHLLQLADPERANSYSTHHSNLRGMAYATAAGSSVLGDLSRPQVFVTRVINLDKQTNDGFDIELSLPAGRNFDENAKLYIFQSGNPIEVTWNLSLRDGAFSFKLDDAMLQGELEEWELLAISANEEAIANQNPSCDLFAIQFLDTKLANPRRDTLADGMLLQAWRHEHARLPEWAFLAWAKECFATQRRLLRDEAAPDLKSQRLPPPILALLNSYDRLLEKFQQAADERFKAWCEELRS